MVAPGIVVEGEEIAALVICTAVHVLGHIPTGVLNISGRVANWDRTVALAVDILSHVTGSGLDIRRGVGSIGLVDNLSLKSEPNKDHVIFVDTDLVAREEKQSVVIALEHINRGKHALQVNVVVRRSWVCLVDGVQRRVDIQCKVNASLCKRAHALVVVLAVVNGIHTDSVDAEFLEFLDISLASLSVGDWIFSFRRSSWLVVDTADVKSLVAGEESYDSSLVIIF